VTTTGQPKKSDPWPRLGVHKLPGTHGWMVPSESIPGAFRHVEFAVVDGRTCFTCTCPAGTERGNMGHRFAYPCRHVRLVSTAEAKDGIPPRPSAPVNVSALCD
jgi:hypothetical protein